LCIRGQKNLLDTIDINGISNVIGKLILSPTRTYLPLIKEILRNHKKHIHGMIHCTGGGQGKVKNFIKNKKIIKDNLMTIPPFFELIKQESGTPLKEMYQVFNMGHRLEIYISPSYANDLISIAKSFNIEAQIIGHVEESDKNEVLLKREGEEWVY